MGDEKYKHLFDEIDLIPEDGVWWRDSDGDAFKRFAVQMIGYGISENDVLIILNGLYRATAHEFGR